MTYLDNNILASSNSSLARSMAFSKPNYGLTTTAGYMLTSCRRALSSHNNTANFPQTANHLCNHPKKIKCLLEVPFQTMLKLIGLNYSQCF